MARLIRENVTWHEPVRDIVAHLVGSGWSDAEILRHSFGWTWSGYDARETFDQLCVMIQGARDKWDRQTGKIKTDTGQAQIDMVVTIWNRMEPKTRKVFLKAVGETEGAGDE